jgi:NADH:ubiquinone oxidoreductase subunit E
MGRHVWVCLGASCRRSGSPELLEQLKQALAEEEDVEVGVPSVVARVRSRRILW